jgi:hypothetical protein
LLTALVLDLHRLAGNQSLILPLFRGQSIGHVKADIEAAEGVPPEEVVLFLSGAPLEDGRTLAEYGILPGVDISVECRVSLPVKCACSLLNSNIDLMPEPMHLVCACLHATSQPYGCMLCCLFWTSCLTHVMQQSCAFLGFALRRFAGSNTSFVIDTDYLAIVSDLKRAIAERAGMVWGTVELTADGACMQDGLTLARQGVKRDSILFLNGTLTIRVRCALCSTS